MIKLRRLKEGITGYGLTSQLSPFSMQDSSTSRNMMTFAHYRFNQFLMAKGQEFMCQVIECNEAYTSKTCSYCGKFTRLGAKK